MDKLKYLGQIILYNKQCMFEGNHRKRCVRKKLWLLKRVSSFDTYVFPFFTYEFQTLVLVENKYRKLTTCQRSMDCRRLNTRRSDKLRCSKIGSKIKIKEIAVSIRTRKWVGHKTSGHRVMKDSKSYHKNII